VHKRIFYAIIFAANRILEEFMSKKISMEDIANKLGVTKNTVSLVFRNMPGISDKTRKSVLEAAKQLGYRYKKDIKKNDSKKVPLKNICLLQSKSTFDTTGFFSFIQLGVESEAKRNNLNVFLHIYDDSVENFEIPFCIKEGIIAGIITLGRVSKNTVKTLMDLRLPLVMIDHYYDNIYIDSVLSDNQCGGYIATEHLINTGHKAIAFSGDINVSISFYDRFQGYLKALSSNGIPLNKDYMLTDKCLGVIINEGLEYVTNELKKIPELPSAFFCCNDMEALAIIRALKSMGYLVPDDISVVGFDNIDTSQNFSPELSTLNVSKELMGVRAVQKLIHRITDPNGPSEKLLISVNLIERQSVKKL
jgi:LacI family transcriptional regulator